jgi:hypothetical protein
MTVARSAVLVLAIAASVALAPLPGTHSAIAAPTRCSAYQPGDRTPERRQLMNNLVAAINRSPYAGTQYAVKKLWLSCDYARVQLKARGSRAGAAPAVLDALMLKVNGEWTWEMFADPEKGAPGLQYLARHSDIPQALTYW